MAIQKTMSKKQTEPKKTSPSASQKYPLKNPSNYVDKNKPGYKKPSYTPVSKAAGRLAKATPTSTKQDRRTMVQRSINETDKVLSSAAGKLRRELGIPTSRSKKSDIKQSAKNAAMRGGTK